MKPCGRYRKRVALHAAAVLTPAEQEAVTRHLRHCRDCREYFAAIISTCGDHERVAHSLTPVEVNERVYRRLFREIRSSPSPKPVPLGPRVAWSLAATALAGFVWILGSGPLPREKAVLPATRAALGAEPVPSLSKQMTYRLALNHSFEQLDDLLAKGALGKDPPGQSLFQFRGAFIDPGL